MRIKINLSECPGGPTNCERCVEQFLRAPTQFQPDCFLLVERDGKQYVTIVPVDGGPKLYFIPDTQELEVINAFEAAEAQN